MDQKPYTVGNARYAKGQMAVRVTSDGSGFKSRADYLLCALKCRYSNRERCFIVSPSKLRKFEQLFADGWGATILGNLIPPGSPLAEAIKTSTNTGATPGDSH